MSIFQEILNRTKDTYIPLKNKLSIQFIMQIEALRKEQGITYKALAEKIGVKPAYVSKVMRGDTNLTHETMAKFAFALGADINLDICNKMEKAERVEHFKIGRLNHKKPIAFAPNDDFEDEQTIVMETANGTQSPAAA